MIFLHMAVLLLLWKFIQMTDQRQPRHSAMCRPPQDLLRLILSLEDYSNEKHKLHNACKWIRSAQFDSTKSHFLVHCALLLRTLVVSTGRIHVIYSQIWVLCTENQAGRWDMILSLSLPAVLGLVVELTHFQVELKIAVPFPLNNQFQPEKRET